jgi:hypothetical protein
LFAAEFYFENQRLPPRLSDMGPRGGKNG